MTCPMSFLQALVEYEWDVWEPTILFGTHCGSVEPRGEITWVLASGRRPATPPMGKYST